MCDEFTDAAHDESLRARGISRREFAAMSGAAALAGCAGSGASVASNDVNVTERMVEVTTADGLADAFFVHPVGGKHPAIVMWPDIAGLREAKKVMARKLAAAGFAVLCVNQYYRGGPAPILESFADWRTPEGQAKIKPLREALTPEAITRDARAWVAFLDAQDAVDTARGIGSNGYCMGGPFTVRTAAAAPGRVRAAASLHGGGLVTEEPDSPHRLLKQTRASFLFAIARNDDAKAPQDKTELRKAADAAGVGATIEVFDADHGWCVPDSPAWNPEAAARAWDMMLVLFGGL